MPAVAFKQEFQVKVTVVPRNLSRTIFTPVVSIMRPGQSAPVAIATTVEFHTPEDAQQHGQKLAEEWFNRQ